MNPRTIETNRWIGRYPVCTWIFLLLIKTVIFGQGASQKQPFTPFPLTLDAGQCTSLPAIPSDNITKSVFIVGVLAIRGPEAAYKEFNKTFSDYLTETAGQRFERPIRFEMKPLNFVSLFTDTELGEVDFFYVNPSAYSCIESEFGAHSLVSQISRRRVGGKTYDSTEFGGVIFTHANSSVNSIHDIKGKTVAAASISGLGSGQMQFRKLIQKGLHFINDPRQIVFTSNQGKVVNGVLNGQFDVGFVRTDQIERTKDENTGELVDKSFLKVIEPESGLISDGKIFPFESTTQLYAEWNVASLNHVPNEVNLAVQDALLAVADHAAVGERLHSCYASSCGDDNSFVSLRDCHESCHKIIALPAPRWDTTPELALLADDAKSMGRYSGWRSTLTYMELRNMQEETGFIRKDSESGKMQCIRSKNIYDAVVCPPGYFKKSEVDVVNGCALAGTPCPGFQCLCKPCVKAFDVNVFPKSNATLEACEKFSICGRLSQREEFVFYATDNKEREGMNLTVTLHEGEVSRQIEVNNVAPLEILTNPQPLSDFVKSQATNFTHMFKLSSNKVGGIVMEVFANGVQIPESPLRVYVDPRDCASEGKNRFPDMEGNCPCATNYILKGDECVSPNQTTTVALVITGGLLASLVLIFFVIFIVRRVRAIRKLQLDHEKKMIITLDEAIRSTVNMDYPLHLLHAEAFIREGTLRRHEPMRDEHKLRVYDTLEAVDNFVLSGKLIVFFSHQWTAFDAPDHSGQQYQSMVKALRAVAIENGYADLENVWVWVDYSCIPQCSASTQALAIRSLAPYASSACAFIIVAPKCEHKNLSSYCDADTYKRRMWCRAEQVCYLMRNGPDNMFLGTGDDDSPLKRVDYAWCQDVLRVFDGELTCCRLEHKGMASCDRQSLVVPILGLYAELYRASTGLLADGNDEVNDSVRTFIEQIKANQDAIFPRDFNFATWEKNKKVTEKVLLFGDLIERMQEHVKEGAYAEVINRVFADEGPKSDTINSSFANRRSSTNFIRHGVVHGGSKNPLPRKPPHKLIQQSLLMNTDNATADPRMSLQEQPVIINTTSTMNNLSKEHTSYHHQEETLSQP